VIVRRSVPSDLPIGAELQQLHVEGQEAIERAADPLLGLAVGLATGPRAVCRAAVGGDHELGAPQHRETRGDHDLGLLRIGVSDHAPQPQLVDELPIGFGQIRLHALDRTRRRLPAP